LKKNLFFKIVEHLMKKLFLFALFTASTLSAQECFEPAPFDPPPCSYSLALEYLTVGTAPLRSDQIENSHLKFQQWNAALGYTYPFNCFCGLIFGAGYVGVVLDLKENPDFKETQFNYVNFSVGGFTKAFPDWTWTLTIAAYLDTASFSFMDHALYQGVLWGKYQFCDWLEFDVGMLIEVGLRKEYVWPIIGLIWFPSPCWRLFAIYPVRIDLEYDFAPYWTAAAALRFLRTRHRVTESEPDSQGIFEYRSTGAEFNITYAPFIWALIKGFAGSTFDTNLKVSNRLGHDTIHFKFKGSVYAGVSAVLSF
jgi:hypothetical protein